MRKKNSDEIRLCVNYKRLNDITVNDLMPMPEIDDILAKLGQSKWYSTVDMCRGYYGVPGLQHFLYTETKLSMESDAFWLKDSWCDLQQVTQNGSERCY